MPRQRDDPAGVLGDRHQTVWVQELRNEEPLVAGLGAPDLDESPAVVGVTLAHERAA